MAHSGYYPSVSSGAPGPAVDAQPMIVIMLDIDDTIMSTTYPQNPNDPRSMRTPFDLSADKSWHGGGAQVWLNSLQAIKEMVRDNGYQLAVHLVTSKVGCDDLVIEVSKKMTAFLGNTWKRENDKDRIYGTVMENGKPKHGYFSIKENGAFHEDNTSPRGNVIIVRDAGAKGQLYSSPSKEAAYQLIQKTYGCPSENMFGVDDSLRHIETLEKLQMHAISFHSLAQLEDPRKRGQRVPFLLLDLFEAIEKHLNYQPRPGLGR